MKLTDECVPCLLKRVAYEVSLCSPEKVADALRECEEVVTEMRSDEISSVEFATEIHRRAYSVLGEKDPYSELKRRSNEVALRLLPEAESFVKKADDRPRAAMITSIIGNLLDFGISGSLSDPELLRKEFQNMVNDPLGWDDSAEIEELLGSVDELFFLADNCGEIVLDKLLLEEIRTIGPRIVLVVKGRPILTDVTREDIEGLGLEGIVDEIAETEGFAIGLDLWSGENDRLVRRLKSSELIISKGMANFEALSEHSWNTIAYLMRVKCNPVASALQVERDTNVIKLIKS